MLESIKKAPDNRKLVCRILIDVIKQFDIVSHDVLLEKQNHYGKRGISNDWFRSYLSDRSQFVYINSFNSDYKTVNMVYLKVYFSFFKMFINDINIATFHFANDTCLLNIKDSVKKINKVVNEDLMFLQGDHS